MYIFSFSSVLKFLFFYFAAMIDSMFILQFQEKEKIYILMI